MPIGVIHRLEITKVLENFIERNRPSEKIRHQLDIIYKIENQSIIIYEVRPAWRRPNEIREHAVAKATFVMRRNIWKVFWLRADLKWYNYDPVPTVKKIQDFVKLVENDKGGYFWG